MDSYVTVSSSEDDDYSNAIDQFDGFDSRINRRKQILNAMERAKTGDLVEYESDYSTSNEEDEFTFDETEEATNDYDDSDDSDEESEESDVESETGTDDDDESSQSSSDDSSSEDNRPPIEIFLDEDDKRAGREARLADIELSVFRLERSLRRRLKFIICLLLLALALPFVFYTSDPFGLYNPVSLPNTANGTTSVPSLPTSPNMITLKVTYSAIFPSRIDDNIDMLISSMDDLTPKVLSDVTSGESVVNTPSSLDEIAEVVCPTSYMTSKNYLCLEVTAAVTLASNDGQVVADFTSALIEAIEVGRLQESREVVHPDSQIIVYKGEFIETPSPSQTSSPATISPSFKPIAPTNKPTSQPTTQPTAGISCSTLSTPADGSSNQQITAIAFELNAVVDVTISELSLHLESEGDLQIEIWTKLGSWGIGDSYPYDGEDWDRRGWTQVLKAEGVAGNGSGQLTQVGSLTSLVSVTEGSTQSFFVWSSSNTALIKDLTNDESQASNNDLSITRGCGFHTKPDSDPSIGSHSIWGNGFEFEGAIEYCLGIGTAPAVRSGLPVKRAIRGNLRRQLGKGELRS